MDPSSGSSPGSGSSSGGGPSGGGSSPQGSRFNPIRIPLVANSNCKDESAEGAAGNSFRIWMLASNPGKTAGTLAANGKFYKIRFNDGLWQTYKWGLSLQFSLPLQVVDGACN